MKCNNCGKEIKENSNFCTECGTSVVEKSYKDYKGILIILVFVAKAIQIILTLLVNNNKLSVQGDGTLATGLGNMFTAFITIPGMFIYGLIIFIVLLVIVLSWCEKKKKIDTGNLIVLIILYVLNTLPIIAITI